MVQPRPPQIHYRCFELQLHSAYRLLPKLQCTLFCLAYVKAEVPLAASETTRNTCQIDMLFIVRMLMGKIVRVST